MSDPRCKEHMADVWEPCALCEIESLQSRLAKIQAIVDSGYCDPYDLRKILDVV